MKDYRAGVLVAEIDLSLGDTVTDLFALRGYSLSSSQIKWESVMGGTDAEVSIETTDSNGDAWDTLTGGTFLVNSPSGSQTLRDASASTQAIRFSVTVNSVTSGTLKIWTTLKG